MNTENYIQADIFIGPVTTSTLESLIAIVFRSAGSVAVSISGSRIIAPATAAITRIRTIRRRLKNMTIFKPS